MPLRLLGQAAPNITCDIGADLCGDFDPWLVLMALPCPAFIPSSDDRWQADMEIRISQLSTDMQMLSDQQAALTGELQAVQDNLSGLDHQIKNTASSVVQFSDALIKDIEN